MNRIACLILFLLFMCTNYSLGADNGEKKGNILKLIELTDISNVSAQVAQSTMLQLAKSDRDKIGSSLTDSALQRICKIAGDILFEQMMKDSTIMNTYYVQYDKYYSNDDIKRLLQFYQSDIGKKMARVTPKLLNETLAAIQAWLPTIMPAYSIEFQKRLKAEGITLPGESQK
jgi:uncharacterized protein